MDLRQLEYVVAVADHGGFTKAAMATHVAQPSLSHGVRSLEAELGVELFARLGRTVQITAAGEEVVGAARRVLRDVAELSAVTAAASGLRTGRLEIVTLPTLAVEPLAQLIGAFRTLHPGITIRVTEPEDASTVERQVSSGRAELGFTDLTTGGRGLSRVQLFRQEVLAVCPPGTSVPDGPLPAAVFAAMPLIATPAGTSTRRLLDRVIVRSGLEPNIVVDINHREAILPLVLAGAGASLLPAPLAREAATRGAVVRSLRPAVTRRIGILHRPGILSPAAKAMLDLARRSER
ncbi:MAG: transcriptional regulator [Ilumatobacteraceae bacterium]|nr:transcriptional regulator [Ilumatobacteraceae bacterium]